MVTPHSCTLLFITDFQVAAALLRLALLNLQHSKQRQAIGTKQPSSDSLTETTTVYAAAVRQLVSDLGPLWVKLGQTLSVRPDVIGSDLATALSGLQVSIPLE